jgi:hypothetical protein
MTTEYGTLAPLVKTVGWLMSAAVAIGLAWRGRAKFEPSEQDLPNGPQKVVGVVSAVGIAVLWSRYASQVYAPFLTQAAIWLGCATVIFLITYGLLISTNTYECERSPRKNVVERYKVIGGFSLTEQARHLMKEKSKTIQEIFCGSGYDADKVWPRVSRSLAKQSFVICYLGLALSATLGLACAGILILLNQK